MNAVHRTFASYGLSLQRDAFLFLNETLENVQDKVDLAERIAQEILNTNANDTLSISRDIAQEAISRLANQSRREFDGADLSVLDTFHIQRPVYQKATDTFVIKDDEPHERSSALANPHDKFLSKADRYNWILSSLKTANNKQYSAITQIKNIIGRSGQSFSLFGMLTGLINLSFIPAVMEEGKVHLEDKDDVVELKFSDNVYIIDLIL